MPSNPVELPNDVAELRTTIAAQSAEIAAQRTRLEATLPRPPGRSNTAAAFRYALARSATLTLVLGDDRACIDNPAGGAIRPITLGRRNCTFGRSNAGDYR